MPTKIFGSVTQKIFVGKLWYPLLFIEFFDTSNFLNHCRDAHEFFRHWETKNFRRKHVIPPIMPKIFPIPQIFLKHWRNAHVIFQPVRPKFFVRKLWYPLLCINFSDTPNFLKHWRDAHKIFRHCETKSFRRKIVIPSIMHETFRYPKFFWNIEGMPTKFFGTVRQKISTETCDTPLLCISFFDTPNFLKHWRDAHEIFRRCETKKFRRENVIPPIIHENYRYP